MPTPDQIREFVIAGHGNLAKVKAMLAEDPSLLNARHQWQDNDFETAIQAAAHVGNSGVAEFLLAQGAPLEICTASMLGRKDVIERLLSTDPTLIQARGAHGIPLLPHAALGGNVELVQMLHERGAHEGVSSALFNAVRRRHVSVARWILEHGAPDLNWKNFEGKTALDVATESGDTELVQLLKARGAR